MLEEESDGQGVSGRAGEDLDKNPEATTSVEDLIALGRSMDLAGSELQSFVKEQQAVEEKTKQASGRRKKARERERERERDRQENWRSQNCGW